MDPTSTQSRDHSTFDELVTIETVHSLDLGIFCIDPLNQSGVGFDLVEWAGSYPGVVPGKKGFSIFRFFFCLNYAVALFQRYLFFLERTLLEQRDMKNSLDS